MRNSQRGFILPVILGIAAGLIICGGIFLYQNKKAEAPVEKNTETLQLNQNEQQVNVPTQPTDTINTSNSRVVASDWKTYKSSDWGFQISYPPQYRFLDQNLNSTGPLHYLIPQKPPAESGNYGTIVEIANVAGDSSVKGILQIAISGLKVKDLKDLNAKLQAQIASSEASNKKNGLSVTLGSISINGQDFPTVTSQSSKEKSSNVYYLQPSSAVLFVIGYTPSDDATLKQIISTIKSTPIIISDQSLYYSATENKDTSWCDKISDSKLKSDCYVAVRGPIFDRFPIDFATIPHNSGGSGGSVDGTTLTIDAKKGSHAWLTGGVTTTSNTNFIEFDAEMINGEQAQSLLTVYLNTQEIGMIDGSVGKGKDNYVFQIADFADIGPNPYSPNPLKPGIYSLGFRLDSFADGKTSVKISNIKIGSVR